MATLRKIRCPRASSRRHIKATRPGITRPAAMVRRRRILLERDGASFDGISDYIKLASDFAGNADGKKCTIAMRGRFNGGDGVLQYIYTADGASKFWLQKEATTGLISLVGRNAAGTTKQVLKTTTGINSSTGYFNLLTSFDAGTLTQYLYLDDVDDLTVVANLDDNIDFTATSHALFARATDGALKANMDCTFFYMNLSEAVDFSVEANRRIFFDSQGSPVLSPTGGGVITGLSDPIAYFGGDFKTWHINQGIGGGFTEIGDLTKPLP